MPSIYKNKKIGKVRVRYLSKKLDTRYRDEVEDSLLELFSEDSAGTKRQQILNSNPSWEQYYHLSPTRGSILDVVNFSEGENVLEIGAGTGAVSEAILRSPVKLTALDISEKRSLINAYRNKEHANLEIIVGNLSQLSDANFDTIVCIGVLEYAGTFINSPDPYVKFLEIARGLLRDGGRMIFAIENRLGLKYLAGSREDHTGGFFDGIHDYPGSKKVKTFGKHELELLIKNAGFRNAKFYYPFPDYKNPQFIFSDSYYPGNGATFPINKLPTPVYGQDRTTIFSESLAMISIEKNNLFRELSNSFLVEVNK